MAHEPTRIARLRVTIDLAYGPARLDALSLHAAPRTDTRRADDHG